MQCINTTEFISLSFEQTISYAALFAQTLSGGEFICLQGELGAGKTVFTKGIAQGLGISEVITSPTFSLHNIYNGKLTLNHFDFYRLNSVEEALVIGVADYFQLPNSVCVCEWASNISRLIPDNCINIIIEKIDENSRKITINNGIYTS